MTIRRRVAASERLVVCRHDLAVIHSALDGPAGDAEFAGELFDGQRLGHDLLSSLSRSLIIANAVSCVMVRFMCSATRPAPTASMR